MIMLLIHLGLKTDTSFKKLRFFHKFRRGPQSEVHMYSPETIVLLQRATQTNDYQLFKEYSRQLESQPFAVRHLLEFDMTQRQAIPLEEVESVDNIVNVLKRERCLMVLFLRKHMNA